MAEEAKNQFNIQKIYIKDVSFESPNAPTSFSFEKWDPQIELNMNNSNQKLNDTTYEAVLTITATVKNNDETSFLAEVHQSGLFNITGLSDQDLAYVLSSQCMTILFPYAREAISELVAKGGFPPLILNPVNFDALYAQHVQKKSEEDQAEDAVKH